eukprot:scaffold15232_cov19-Tisochrysis_lutea.AAC.1
MQMGVTHMWNGVAHELIPHHEWIRNAELFAILKKLVFFKKQRLFLVGASDSSCHSVLKPGNNHCELCPAFPPRPAKFPAFSLMSTHLHTHTVAFRKWHTAVRSIRFLRRQHLLTSSLLHTSPIYGPALVESHALPQIKRSLKTIQKHMCANLLRRIVKKFSSACWMNKRSDYIPLNGPEVASQWHIDSSMQCSNCTSEPMPPLNGFVLTTITTDLTLFVHDNS